MKTKLKLFLGALAFSVLTISVNAQTPPSTADTGVTNSPVSEDSSSAPAQDKSWLSQAVTFEQGVAEAKTITVAAYPSYAPALTVNGSRKPWGFGVAAIYPLGNNLFTGIRGDFLGGSFFAASADVGLKADVQIFGHNVTPFAITGVISPFFGAGQENQSVGGIIGAGFHANVWHSKDKNKTFNVFFEAEHWTIYSDVIIYHPGAAFTLKF